jgi:tripartite-type tricarboxylate transporter receptor subunit TctC
MKKLGGIFLLMGSLAWAQSPAPSAPPSVPASAFPHKAIRWVIAAPAGSSLDAIARAMQDKLKDQLGQPIVIENKPQAGGTLAVGEVAKSAPDGHTWVLGFNGPLAFAPFLYNKLPYQPQRDLQPVMLTSSQPNVIAVSSSLPVSNLPELLALMKTKPGQYNYASVGNGSSSHLTMEYLKALTGSYAVHIPFNGSPPAVLSVVGGDTHMLATVPTVINPQIKAGRLKAIASTGAHRFAAMPDVPTVAEAAQTMPALKGFEALAWNGVLVAAGTPRVVVERINAALNTALKDAQVQERFKAAGLDAAGGSPEQFAKLMLDEAKKWQPIIVRSGARLD